MWQRLRAEGLNINSTWIDEAGPGQAKSARKLWQRIENEIRASCGLILYAEKPDFPLKGALVEVGMALGMGKRVKVVLDKDTLDMVLSSCTNRPVGSWIMHPKVGVHNTVQFAYDTLQRDSHDPP
jgi:hypothetical protein